MPGIMPELAAAIVPDQTNNGNLDLVSLCETWQTLEFHLKTR